MREIIKIHGACNSVKQSSNCSVRFSALFSTVNALEWRKKRITMFFLFSIFETIESNFLDFFFFLEFNRERERKRSFFDLFIRSSVKVITFRFFFFFFRLRDSTSFQLMATMPSSLVPSWKKRLLHLPMRFFYRWRRRKTGRTSWSSILIRSAFT